VLNVIVWYLVLHCILHLKCCQPFTSFVFEFTNEPIPQCEVSNFLHYLFHKSTWKHITRKPNVRESRMTFALLQLTTNANLLQLLMWIWTAADIKFLIQGHILKSKRRWKDNIKAKLNININNVDWWNLFGIWSSFMRKKWHVQPPPFCKDWLWLCPCHPNAVFLLRNALSLSSLHMLWIFS
jgi:hypothetical protein